MPRTSHLRSNMRCSRKFDKWRSHRYVLCVLAVCFLSLSQPSQGPYRKAMPCAVGTADNSRRQALGGDEFDQTEEARPQPGPQGASGNGAREGIIARERRRDIYTPPVVEDIIAGALVGAVTGAVAGAGSGAALGGAGTTGLAGAAGGAASGAALGLTSGAIAGAALATANPDVAAAGVGAAGIGAAAGVAAVLNRVQIVRQDQYGQWPPLLPPPVAPQYMERPMAPDPFVRKESVMPEAPVVREPEHVPEAPPPVRSDRETNTDTNPGQVQQIPPQSFSAPEQSFSEPENSSAAKVQAPMHKGWKRASTVSLRRASSMLSAEIEAKSGEVVAKGLDSVGILLSRLQHIQVACQAAITKATEETIQRARSLGLKAKAREGDDM